MDSWVNHKRKCSHVSCANAAVILYSKWPSSGLTVSYLNSIHLVSAFNNDCQTMSGCLAHARASDALFGDGVHYEHPEII